MNKLFEFVVSVEVFLQVGVNKMYEFVVLYVSGEVIYIDDIVEVVNILYVVLGLLLVVYGKLLLIDLELLKKQFGVVVVYIVVDFFGENNCGLLLYDDFILVVDELCYIGQFVFVVIVIWCELVWCVVGLVKQVIQVELLLVVLIVLEVYVVGQYVLLLMYLMCGELVEQFVVVLYWL